MSEPEKQLTILQFDVPPGYREAERLDVYLTEKIQNATRAKVQRGIKEGQVEVNGKVQKKPSSAVQPGDKILCSLMRPPRVEVLPEPIPLDIHYEDDDVIVVNKPVGMVVHPAYGHRTGTLVHALLYHVGGAPITVEDDETDTADDTGLSTLNASPRFEGDVVLRPGIVHRLDKDTSGLMVAAKNDVAHVALSRQFMERTTRRTYEAIIWGVPSEKTGTIDAEVARDQRDRRKMAVVTNLRNVQGKRAETHYRILEHFGYTTLAEFKLETGRTHQIRVHAAHLNHPIFGDKVYGGDRIRFGLDQGQRKAFYRNLFEKLPRQALHARSLGFKHPSTGEEMDFEVERPSDMEYVIERLRAYDHA